MSAKLCNSDRFVVSRKLFACKPQLKTQVGRRHNDAHVKFANVVCVSTSKACSAFVLHDEFMLF